MAGLAAFASLFLEPMKDSSPHTPTLCFWGLPTMALSQYPSAMGPVLTAQMLLGVITMEDSRKVAACSDITDETHSPPRTGTRELFLIQGEKINLSCFVICPSYSDLLLKQL
jgi:hypothetical protein